MAGWGIRRSACLRAGCWRWCVWRWRWYSCIGVRGRRSDFICLTVYISVAAGVASGGSALTAGHFFKRQKVTKRLRPDVRPARWGSGFLRCGTDPGAAAPVCFAAPTLAVFGCAKRSLRSHARINPSTQPTDGL
ncbi:hypothetical protein EVS84_21460 [Pseudomonas koreensis]|uniref:Uncharacterized protein n=1 Tax=Pseudomonas koreensis TaxID=198620 RepID=A0A4Q4KYW3_9PSED|nr:hypothetical protein EVS84_21460 [Pseudomonas koreensis]